MLGHDVDESQEPSVVLFCPPCAGRVLGYESRAVYE